MLQKRGERGFIWERVCMDWNRECEKKKRKTGTLFLHEGVLFRFDREVDGNGGGKA